MTAKRLKQLFGYTDSVIGSKPVRQHGESLQDFPTYTIPEAALFLGISQRTARYWFTPEKKILSPTRYWGDSSIALLSFRDLAEAYVLAVLTKFYKFRVSDIRMIVANAKKETGLHRPLVEADLKVLFKTLVLEKPARGRLPRRMVDLSRHRNLVFPELVDQLGKRILRNKNHDPLTIYPWRLLTANDESRPVSIDPEIVSGRLVVTGTRIPVSVILGKKMAGKSSEQIANSYRISVDSVEKAIQHIDRPVPKKVGKHHMNTGLWSKASVAARVSEWCYSD